MRSLSLNSALLHLMPCKLDALDKAEKWPNLNIVCAQVLTSVQCCSEILCLLGTTKAIMAETEQALRIANILWR